MSLNFCRFSSLLVLSLLLVSKEAAGQYARGSGSHQHMKNPPHLSHNHQHYVPKKIQPAPGVPAKDHSLLQEKELLQDREHLREELGETFTDEQIAKMSSAELEFHYFKLHDFDDNNKLDGLEMLNAITHIMPHDPVLDLRKKGDQNLSEPERLALAKHQMIYDEQMRSFIEMIDSMIRDADKDKDGFINYSEYAAVTRANKH